jgi:hypothetical protein
MPNRTFAFSHRGGFWKTRYTFFSTAYATLNKIMLGFDTLLDQALTWTHNTGGNTVFYNGAASGSGISVTFNDLPSAKKIYKSVSVEGTNNILGGGTILVNNSTTNNQVKASPMFAFEDKGGILYGKIEGLSQMSNANIKPVGHIVAATSLGQTFRFQMNWVDGGQGNTSPNATYIFYNGEAFFYDTPANSILLGGYNQAADFEDVNFSAMGGNFLDINFSAFIANAVGGPVQNSGNTFQTPNVADFNTDGVNTVSVFSITSEEVNGDQLRGQIADAVFVLGAADYELYALNLEYEATTYDHSLPQRSTAKRARRRTV